MNVPADSGWYWTVLSNSVVIAGIKIGHTYSNWQSMVCVVLTLDFSGFTALVVPKASMRMVLFRFGLSKDDLLEADATTVLMSNKLQVGTTILVDVFTVVVSRVGALNIL